MTLDDAALAHLLRRVQSGTVRRSQILELGGSASDIARMTRRRDLRPVYPGVYVDHTGVVALRTPDFENRVQWLKDPPRISPEHAIIDVMQTASAENAFEAIASLCHTRVTSPAEVRRVLDSRGRIRGRSRIEGLIQDLATGSCSVLERGYAERVERPHHLPRADRQVAFQNGGRRGYHDVKYPRFGLVVELDGRAFHNTVSGWNDSYERDLAVAVSGSRTARLSYRQVFATPCRTALQVAALLELGGWRGDPARCPSCIHS